jgi:hypothetical protein
MKLKISVNIKESGDLDNRLLIHPMGMRFIAKLEPDSVNLGGTYRVYGIEADERLSFRTTLSYNGLIEHLDEHNFTLGGKYGSKNEVS